MSSGVIFQPHQAMLFEPSYDDAGFERLWLAERRVDVVEWTRVGDAWDARWKKTRPYINIVELILPRRDGIECAKRLRAFDKDCKIILVTSIEGKWGADIVKKALDAGIDGIIPKPFRKERFMVGLDYILNLPGRKKK